MARTGYRVNLHIDACEGTGVYVKSPDLPGLHLAGESFQSMKSTIEIAIKKLFKDNHHVDVEVTWITEIGSFKSQRNEQEQVKEIAVFKLAA